VSSKDDLGDLRDTRADVNRGVLHLGHVGEALQFGDQLREAGDLVGRELVLAENRVIGGSAPSLAAEFAGGPGNGLGAGGDNLVLLFCGSVATSAAADTAARPFMTACLSWSDPAVTTFLAAWTSRARCP